MNRELLNKAIISEENIVYNCEIKFSFQSNSDNSSSAFTEMDIFHLLCKRKDFNIPDPSSMAALNNCFGLEEAQGDTLLNVPDLSLKLGLKRLFLNKSEGKNPNCKIG